MTFLIVAAARVPPADLSDIIKTLIAPSWFHPAGWIATAVTVVVSGLLLWRQRAYYVKEIDRLSDQRNQYQQLLQTEPNSSKLE